VLDLQKQLATALNRHLDKIYANKAEIERLTLEATEKGLTAKAEIDKYVVKAIVAGAKHESHIATLVQLGVNTQTIKQPRLYPYMST
jgi:hypothetical protein